MLCPVEFFFLSLSYALAVSMVPRARRLRDLVGDRTGPQETDSHRAEISWEGMDALALRALSDSFVTRPHLFDHREHRSDGVFCDRGGVGRRCIDHLKSALLTSVEVDMIDTNRQCPEPTSAELRWENVWINVFFDTDDQGISLFEIVSELLRRRAWTCVDIDMFGDTFEERHALWCGVEVRDGDRESLYCLHLCFIH